jgi:hypothetical protein
MSARSEPSVTMNSTKKDSEVGETQLTTTTAPLISKANEIQTSTKVEVKIKERRNEIINFLLRK